jgi:hypothetical protein
VFSIVPVVLIIAIGIIARLVALVERCCTVICTERHGWRAALRF